MLVTRSGMFSHFPTTDLMTSRCQLVARSVPHRETTLYSTWSINTEIFVARSLVHRDHVTVVTIATTGVLVTEKAVVKLVTVVTETISVKLVIIAALRVIVTMVTLRAVVAVQVNVCRAALRRLMSSADL